MTAAGEIGSRDENRGALMGLIAHLGISQAEAAKIIGIDVTTLSRKLAGAERYEVRDKDLEALQALAGQIDQFVERAIEFTTRQMAEAEPETPSDFSAGFAGAKIYGLSVYRKDEDVPPWVGGLASVHRMAMTRLAAALRKSEIDARLIAFDPVKYKAWLGSRSDDRQAREEWVALQARPSILGLKIQKDGIGWWKIRA